MSAKRTLMFAAGLLSLLLLHVNCKKKEAVTGADARLVGIFHTGSTTQYLANG